MSHPYGNVALPGSLSRGYNIGSTPTDFNAGGPPQQFWSGGRTGRGAVANPPPAFIPQQRTDIVTPSGVKRGTDVMAGINAVTGIAQQLTNVDHSFTAYLRPVDGGYESTVAAGQPVYPMRTVPPRVHASTTASRPGRVTTGQFTGGNIQMLNMWLDQSTHQRFAHNARLSDTMSWAWHTRPSINAARYAGDVPDVDRIRQMISPRAMFQMGRVDGGGPYDMFGSKRANTAATPRLFSYSGGAEETPMHNIWGNTTFGSKLYMYLRYFGPGEYPYDSFMTPDGGLIEQANANPVVQMWPLQVPRTGSRTLPACRVNRKTRAGHDVKARMPTLTPRSTSYPAVLTETGVEPNPDPRADLDFVNADGRYEFGELYFIGTAMSTPAPIEIETHLKALRIARVYDALPTVKVALAS